MTVFSKMPEEMLEQIVSSLPPKTLMRFKCISKWWYAFINSPKFVAKHLSNSMHNNLSTCVVLNRSVLRDTNTNEIELVFSLLNFCNGYNDGEPGFLSGVDDMKIPLSTRSDSDSLRVIGYWIEVMGGNPGERDFVPCYEVWVGNTHECVFDPSVEASNPPGFSVSVKSRSDLPRIIGHCNGIICLANPSELLAYPSHVFLWNPAIQEFKLLPPEPYLRNWPTGGGCGHQPDWPEDVRYLPSHQFTVALGFGYDSKSKDYKVVNIGFNGSVVHGQHYIIYPPKAVIYTLSSDSWKEIKTDSLETETTNLWPESFQLYFNGMCYWLGHEQDKEVNVFELHSHQGEFIRDVIILFDTNNEVFHDILLPDNLCDSLRVYCYDMHLLVWNESVALLGMCNSDQSNFRSFGIWVMDEFSGVKDVWTKHITFDLTERPLTFWKSDEILMIAEGGRIFSYNFSTKMRKDLPFQSLPEYFASAIVYVKSIVSVKGDNNLESSF